MKPRYQSPVRGVATYGPQAAAWTERYLRVQLMRWQREAMDHVLACDEQGRLIHRAYLISVGRQNGKSTIARGLAGWTLDASPWGGMVLGAAYDRAQAGIIYRQVASDFEADTDLAARYNITKHQGITGERSEYRTTSAESRSARGYSAALVLFDEVMTQRDESLWAALYPTTSATGGLMAAMSTAGDESSALLRTLYDHATSQADGIEEVSESFGYTIFEAESDEPTEDNIIAANPSIAEGLLTIDDVRSEMAILSSGAFARERLNRWTTSRDRLFGAGEWTASIASAAPLGGFRAVSVDASPDWAHATIAIAIFDTTRCHIEVARDYRPQVGTQVDPTRLVQEALDLADRNDAALYFEAGSAISPHMRYTGTQTVTALGGMEVREACAAFYSLVLAGRLTHLDDPLLERQLADAVRSDHEGAWRFVRRRSYGYIDALLAVAYAAYGATEPAERLVRPVLV